MRGVRVKACVHVRAARRGRRRGPRPRGPRASNAWQGTSRTTLSTAARMLDGRRGRTVSKYEPMTSMARARGIRVRRDVVGSAPAAAATQHTAAMALKYYYSCAVVLAAALARAEATAPPIITELKAGSPNIVIMLADDVRALAASTINSGAGALAGAPSRSGVVLLAVLPAS